MDQAVNYIALAIPVFFLLIGVEVLVARRHHGERRLYRFNDSISDLSCGILQQVTTVFTKTAVFAGYVLLFEWGAWLELPQDRAWAWIVAFLGVDFCYYWFHRTSHQVNAVWASHIVHHQSEEYNLSVALRQGSVQPMFSAPFYWPLALVGVSPLMFLTLSSFNTLYQFWIHTRTIGRLGPLEWVLNTPSHHRVHHGCNPKYIDRNHAGTLIVWDRLFGTFQAEEEEPIYGVTRPLSSWNPVWANLAYFADLWRASRTTRRWADKLKVWVMPPAWRPPDVPIVKPAQTPLTGHKYDASAPPGLNGYVLGQFVTAIAATVALLFMFATLPAWLRVGLAAYVVWTLVDLGAIFERRPWLPLSEALRLGATATTVVLAAPATAPWAGAAAIGVAGASYWWLRRYRNSFGTELPAPEPV